MTKYSPEQSPAVILAVVALASRAGKYGGPLDTALRQLEVLEGLGFECSLMAGFLKGDAPQGMNTGGILKGHQVRPIWPGMNFSALHSFRMFVGLDKAIKKADYVFISFGRDLIPLSALFLARVRRRIVVIQPHGMLTSRTSVAHRLLDRFVLKPLIGKSPIRVLALTDVEEKYLREWGFDLTMNIFVLGNPLPSDLADQLRTQKEPSPNEALFIGRLHKRKRVDVFLRAAEAALSHDWNDRYVVVGPDGGELKEVEETAGRLANLTYEGVLSVSGVTHRVAQTRIFVLPSENEPWGNVLAIALAMGKPVVVCESAALAQSIKKYGAGIVVPDGSHSDLSDAIHLLLTNEECYNSAALGAKNFATDLLTNSAQRKGLSAVFSASKHSL